MATLRCDMDRNCTAEVTHIDCKGWLYCAQHGTDRCLSGIRCRKFTASERKRLENDQPISYGRKA